MRAENPPLKSERIPFAVGRSVGQLVDIILAPVPAGPAAVSVCIDALAASSSLDGADSRSLDSDSLRCLPIPLQWSVSVSATAQPHTPKRSVEMHAYYSICTLQLDFHDRETRRSQQTIIIKL